MKKVLAWFKWIGFRKQIATFMHEELKTEWSRWQCWKYSSCFKWDYEQKLSAGDEPDPQSMLEEELHCWTD